MWRSIDMWNLGDLHAMPYNLEKMCRHPIDRSCGCLVDINIEYFGTDELLAYITQRASILIRLRPITCWDISNEGLSEAAKKFPLLEELEIYSGNTGKDAIEVVGRCCPLLKTFKFNGDGIRDPAFQDDKEALAIGEHMHGLRHLQLVGNNLTNHGLRAILDGCRYLESLDLRRCFHVNLKGDMGRRCAEQIKLLRWPNDSVDDFEFNAEIHGSGYSNIDYTSFDFSFDYDYHDGFDGYNSDFNVFLI